MLEYAHEGETACVNFAGDFAGKAATVDRKFISSLQ